MKSVRQQQRPVTDWNEIHARLAHAAAMTRQVLTPSPERAAIVLEERARRLAQPLAAPRADGVLLDVVVFRLSGEGYAIETRYVREVCRFAALMPVPGTPDFVAGIANLRGQILVVFDVCRLFDLDPQPQTEASRIIVCGDGQPDLGLLVDSANDVVRLPPDCLHPNAMAHRGNSARLIRGVSPDAIIVIDGARLLADQRLFVDQPRRQ